MIFRLGGLLGLFACGLMLAGAIHLPSRSESMVKGCSPDSIVSHSAGDPASNYYAVLVGISDYPGTSNDLHYCHRDAEGIQDLLISNFFFPASNVQLLVNSSAMKVDIKTAIDDLQGKTTGNDTVVFYFSGHGSQDGSTEYLVPYDGLLGPKIMDTELATWLDALEFDRMLVIIDSCYSGGILDDLSSPGIVGMSACSKGELSYEADTFRHGVFTHYLIDSFSRNASQRYVHDANGDTCIDLAQEAFVHVNESTAAYYAPLNFTVSPQMTAWTGQLVLDWQLDVDGVVYSNGSRFLKLGFEPSRTREFFLSIQHGPVSYFHQELVFSGFYLHQVLVSNATSPVYIPLTFLGEDTNQLILIDQTVHHQPIFYQYNPYTTDFDGDGIPDGVEWEMRPLYDPGNGADGILDHDGDGLGSEDEFYMYHTNPQLADTDGDGYVDGDEVAAGTDPLNGVDSPLSRELFIATASVGIITIFILAYYRKRKRIAKA